MIYLEVYQLKAVGTTLLAALLVALASGAKGQDAYTLHDYVSDCAEMIAEAPVFDCQSLDLIPITVNGRTPDVYTPHMQCDRPAMLPYPKTTDGQCAPYSRMTAYRDDDIQMILLCRRMYIRPIDDPNFDSIEIIMHNVKSGSTCFFISKNFGGKPEGDNGSRVPPPTEFKPPDGEISAEELWATPQEVVNHGCIYCHDSDPWMRTPWVAQTGQLPANPWGFHSVDVGGPFVEWPKPKSIATRGNSCVGCHRIGSLNTCQTMDIPLFGEQPAKMLQAIGQAPHGRLGARLGTIYESPPVPYNQWASNYPHSAWMPIGNELSYTEWRRIYEQDVKDLERCCEDPEAPGCIVSPIQGLQAWLEQHKAAPAENTAQSSKLKHNLRNAAKRTIDTVCDTIAGIFESVTPQQCNAYFLEAG